jgi:carboxyl-terminal processing protease
VVFGLAGGLLVWPILAQAAATSQPTSAGTRWAHSAPTTSAAGSLLWEGTEKALAGQFDEGLALVRQAATLAPREAKAQAAQALLEDYLHAAAGNEKERAAEYAAAVRRVGWYCLAQDYQGELTRLGLDKSLRQKVRQVIKAANSAIAGDRAEGAGAAELAKAGTEMSKAIDDTQVALKEVSKLLARDSSEYALTVRKIAETVAQRLAACKQAWSVVEASDARRRKSAIRELRALEEDLAEDLADLDAMTGEKPWRNALMQARLAAKRLAAPSDRTEQQQWLLSLVKRVEELGRQAVEKADWDDALVAYAGLEDLDEANETYRDMVKQARRHVRVLRLYGKEPTTRPAEVKTDLEPAWQELVEGVDADMVEKAISQLDGNYVKALDYRKVARGALLAIETLVETPQAARSFSALADSARKQAFLKEIDGLLKTIEKTDRPDHLDLTMALNGVLRASERTVGLPTEVLAAEFTDGFLEELDEYSSMIWPHDMGDFKKQTMGHFYGVGIQISKEPGEPLKVVTPLAGSPAFKAGIRPGDLILNVDGRATEDLHIDKLVRMISGDGERGTKVTLRMRRTGRGEPFDVTLTREEINIQTVRGWRQNPDGSWDYLVDPQAKIGYLRITQFTDQTPADVAKALSEMSQTGVRSLVVDLRFNPGGVLRSATDVADEFLRSGCLVSTEGRQTRRTDVNASPGGKYVDGDLVVLVNWISASAAEILSGAVKDWNRGLIVGQRTYGKGNVQNVIQIRRDRAKLKLTTAFYYLPSGRCLHRQNGAKDWGVDPDIEVKLTPKQIKRWLDIRQKTDLLQDVGQEELSGDLARQYDADAQLRTAVLMLKLRQLQDAAPAGVAPVTATAAIQEAAR